MITSEVPSGNRQNKQQGITRATRRRESISSASVGCRSIVVATLFVFLFTASFFSITVSSAHVPVASTSGGMSEFRDDRAQTNNKPKTIVLQQRESEVLHDQLMMKRASRSSRRRRSPGDAGTIQAPQGNAMMTSTISSPPPSSWKNFTFVCNAEDLQSLEALLTPESSTTYRTPLNGSNCCTDWFGISCNSAGRVVSIDMQICGTLPSSFNLPFLQSFDISLYGCFSGTLPAEWGRMVNLQQLVLTGTQIHGTLPKEWGSLSNLTYLDLSITSVGGTLPAEWSGMSSIELLFLHITRIEGTLPAAWGALTNLRMLRLSSLPNISGSLPVAWNSMKNLNNLDLCTSGIGGTLPREWSNMTNLQGLTVCDSDISGTIPPEWANMSSLSTLFLYQTQISGTLPPQFGRMSRLRNFQAHQTRITGTLPPEWGNMTSLVILYLYQTFIHGTIPREWSGMSFLGVLDLSNTQIEGSIPRELVQGASNLQTLILGTTLISGTIPEASQFASFLIQLDVSSTNLSGTLPCVAINLHAERSMGISSLPPSNTICNVNVLSISYTSISQFPSNFSAVFPYLYRLSMRGLAVIELPPIADPGLGNSGFHIMIDAADNVLNLELLSSTQNFTTPQLLDFTPRYLQTPVNFQNMCQKDCSVTGPYTAQAAPCVNPIYPLCSGTAQSASFSFQHLELLRGNFSSGITAAVIDNSAGIGNLLDLTCPVVKNALMVPTLVQVSPSVLPWFATPVPLPSWNGAPIAFPPTGIDRLRFTGLDTVQLLHGVQYRLELDVELNGFYHVSQSCDVFPYTYTARTTSIYLAPCGTGFLALNFTQACVVCPPLASCSNTLIFAAANSDVWRPSANSLPFATCQVGSQGCRTEAALTRTGMECATGYSGPLCGACDVGFGRSGSNDCASCLSQTVNLVVVAAAAVAIFCVVTYAAVGTTKKGETPSPRVQLGQQAVKLLTNHFSLFSTLLGTTIAASMKTAARTTLLIQHTATTPSPSSNTFVSCLFPSLTANEVFLAAVLVVPFLVGAEILLVRVVHHKWEVASVSSVVLQLSYLQVIETASQLLRHRSLTFYESTLYMTGNTGSPDAILYQFDLLEADVRINFSENYLHYTLAWLVICGFGLGVPLWFACAFQLLRKASGCDATARRKLRFLVSNYKSRNWYWESVITARKGLSVALVAALADYPILQLQALMVLFTVYIILEEGYAPFLSQRRQAAERASYAAAIFTCNAMIASYSVDGGNDSFSVALAAMMILVQVSAAIALGRVLYLDYLAAQRSTIFEGDLTEEIMPTCTPLNEEEDGGGEERRRDVPHAKAHEEEEMETCDALQGETSSK